MEVPILLLPGTELLLSFLPLPLLLAAWPHDPPSFSQEEMEEWKTATFYYSLLLGGSRGSNNALGRQRRAKEREREQQLRGMIIIIVHRGLISTLVLSQMDFSTLCSSNCVHCPDHRRWCAKWKLSQNAYTLHTSFCTFSADLYAQSVLNNKISASELSQRFIKIVLVVGQAAPRLSCLCVHACLGWPACPGQVGSTWEGCMYEKENLPPGRFVYFFLV